MAIVEEMPGLEVQVHANSQQLREYEDRHADVPARTTENYIEAQSDETFEIHYSFKAPFPTDRHVSMIVTIDGKDVDEPIIRPDELYGPDGHISDGPIFNDGCGWVKQKYRFAPLHIREASNDPLPEDLKDKLQPVGIITCEFYFLNNTQRNRHCRLAQKQLEELGTVNEKAIKGDSLSHQAIFGATEPAQEIEYLDADYADNGEPFASFHFYYRSLNALKDLHIIDRTPDPISLLDSEDTALGQLNREQLEAIVRRFREQAETRTRMKRERSDSETIVGDGDDIGEGGDPDFIEIRAVDLRQKRKLARTRQVPGEESVVIELD